jgi:DinB superfamily
MTSATLAIAPPELSDYAPYWGRYISLVDGKDVIRALEQQGPETVAMLSGLTEQQGAYRYAPEKWSLKEVLGHITDSERVFAYRTLRIARNDATPLPGFEQDDYVHAAMFGNRTLAALLDEFAAVRQASLLLFRSLDADAWMRRGVADQKDVSVRALAYIIAGHELHHRKIIQEKYLNAPAGR